MLEVLSYLLLPYIFLTIIWFIVIIGISSEDGWTWYLIPIALVMALLWPLWYSALVLANLKHRILSILPKG